MKVGAQNSKKTALAVGLFVVAVFLMIRTLSGPSTPATSTRKANASGTSAATHPAEKRASVRRSGRTGSKSASADKSAPPNLDPRLRLDLLKQAESVEYTGTGRNIFIAQMEDAPKIPQPVEPGLLDLKKSTPSPTPVNTTPPPINLKFFGFANQTGSPKKVFLATNDGDVFVATEGDVVQRRYKIVKINNNNIEVQDVLSNNRQTIPLTAG